MSTTVWNTIRETTTAKSDLTDPNQICYTSYIMSNFNFIDLFAGIGGIRIPYEKLGGTCVFSSEGINTPETYITSAKYLLVNYQN